MFTSTMFASILPEILILVLGILVLVVEPFWKEEKRRNVGWLTAGGLFAAMIISFLFGQPGQSTSTLGGMVRFDWLGFFFKMLFMFAGAATSLLLMDNEKVGHRGEGYLLLLASLLGMNLMAASADLVMLYLAIETTSIPLYVLSGFMLADEKSTEAGFKYLLFGALTSSVTVKSSMHRGANALSRRRGRKGRGRRTAPTGRPPAASRIPNTSAIVGITLPGSVMCSNGTR